MLLNNNYRYIGLDFETTGLDNTKDEPIQIGIIEIDPTGTIIDSYQSLIQPTSKRDELKHIVGFITGLSLNDLENAPTREQVQSEIAHFFGENTIIIWHNITFDLGFLQKFFPTLNYHHSIDTMQIGQTMIHYAPSYALEVLIENLKEDEIYKSIFAQDNHGEEKAHDAFFDTKNSLKLFVYGVKYVENLVQKYPNLQYIIQQTKGIWWEIWTTTADTTTPSIRIKFPSLEKITPKHTSIQSDEMSIDTANLANHKKYYIGHIPIKDFLTSLASNKKIILAFQSIQKLDIAKSVLNDIGIKNIGYTKEEQTIHPEMFEKFLNKWSFSQEECFFIIKYISHLSKGLGVLNLNTQYDYKIYYYIKDSRNQTKYPIVLTTHHGLFTSMQDMPYTDYDICFFDTEQRYKSYNFFLSSPCDMYYTLNILEAFLYQQEVDHEIDPTNQISADLQQFINAFQIFVGVLFTETKHLFTKTEATILQHDPIQDHGDFYQTNLLRKQLLEKHQSLASSLSSENYATITKHLHNIQKVFDNVVNINKKMYGNSDFYFTYSEAQKFTDRKEFIEIFGNKIVFFTNTNTQALSMPRTKPTNTSSAFLKTMPPVIDTLVQYIVDEVQKNPDDISYFIFSPKKEESKKIFEDLCKNNIHTQATLLVENITWGFGKNIFKAKQSKNKIIIWWYNFILSLYAGQVPIKEIILFNARWPSEQSIIDDIKWYNTKQS